MSGPGASEKSGILISSFGVLASALLWLLGFKIVALWMGPEGVGLFSQLRQMVQAATVGATFGGTNSVVQGISERPGENERHQLRATAVRLIAAAGLLVVIVALATAPQITRVFLSSSSPALVLGVQLLALAVLLNIISTYIIAVLNGYRRYGYLSLAQIAGPMALVVLLAGARFWHVTPDPLLLASSFVLCCGITCAIGAFGMSRLPGLPGEVPSPGQLPTDEKDSFIRFAFSNLLAALSTTVAMLLIRSWIIEEKGLAFAGLFDAGWTLTFNYITLFLTACSTIYLPMLTAASGAERQRACMLKAAYLVLGATILICYSMVVLRGPLLMLLYSDQFLQSSQVVSVLVVAIIFRSVSWVYGTMILAMKNSRVLLFSDVALNLGLMAAVKLALLNSSSLVSLAWTFVAAHFFYLIFVVEYANYKNPLIRRRSIWPLLVVGVAPLIFMALAGSSYEHLPEPAIFQWCSIAYGLAVSVASFVAYRKILP